jgi:protein-disulfide isomerase
VATYQKNADADGIESTPSFLIDGQKYSNMSYEEFSTILDEKLGG